jgi:predicted nucleotide-binding protein (sugar kinase/HSP70/actin superfamily)
MLMNVVNLDTYRTKEEISRSSHTFDKIRKERNKKSFEEIIKKANDIINKLAGLNKYRGR